MYQTPWGNDKTAYVSLFVFWLPVASSIYSFAFLLKITLLKFKIPLEMKTTKK